MYYNTMIIYNFNCSSEHSEQSIILCIIITAQNIIVLAFQY